MTARITRFVLLVCCSLASIGPVGAATTGRAAADDTLDGWVGAYAFSGGDTERTRLRAELDRVANEFGFLIRDIARGRLHDDVRVDRTVEVERLGDALHTRIGRRIALLCDGSAQPVRGINGEMGDGTCVLARNRVTVVVVYENATQTYVLARSGDHSQIHMRVAIASGPLPDTIRYRLTYRRRP